ncbi:unnamed protein product [Alopecurus aequalis]
MHRFTMAMASASQNMVAATVSSSLSHTKRPRLLPEAAPLSGVLFHRRRLGWALLAACNPSAPGDFVCTKKQQWNANLRVDKYFEAQMIVQDCELDKYGVVNNVIYASYIEKAREEMLVSLGISTECIISSGNAMAISELNLKYFTPLRRGDKFVVKVRVVMIKGVRIFVEHLIETLPDHKLVLDARASAVCLNTDCRPTRVFPEMFAKLQGFFSSKDDK